MAVPIRMPMPGQMTEECTVLQWFKAEGDTIAKGDPLFEIETFPKTQLPQAPPLKRNQFFTFGIYPIHEITPPSL